MTQLTERAVLECEGPARLGSSKAHCLASVARCHGLGPDPAVHTHAISKVVVPVRVVAGQLGSISAALVRSDSALVFVQATQRGQTLLTLFLRCSTLAVLFAHTLGHVLVFGPRCAVLVTCGVAKRAIFSAATYLMKSASQSELSRASMSHFLLTCHTCHSPTCITRARDLPSKFQTTLCSRNR